jgi:Xaa-Pro dipeptidase
MSKPNFQNIPLEEYHQRIDKAKKLLRKYKMDALVLYDPENLRYYAGFNKVGMGVERRWRIGFVIPRDNDPVFIAPYVMEKSAVNQVWTDDIRGWAGPPHLNYTQDHEKLCADILKEIKAKVVGIELGQSMNSFLSYIEFQRIRKHAPRIKFVDACDLIWDQRMIKSQFEQDLIRELHKKLNRALNNSRKVLREGITEKEYEQAMYYEFVKEGMVEGAFISRMLMSGPGRYDVVIMGATDTKLKKGDTLWIDGGPRYKNYWSDIQRNICIGKPTDKVQRFWDAALSGQLEAVSAVKPGNKASDIWDAGQRGIKKIGDFVPPSTRCGHGMGLNSHEPPIFHSADILRRLGEKNRELQPGMYITVEVGVKDPAGELTLMWPEDNLLVTENGYENLSEDLPMDLWVVE